MDSKTKNEIEIEFSRAYSQADELEKIAADLSNLASSDIENAISLLKRCWKGECGNKYLEKGSSLANDMFDVAQELLKVSKSIRLTADLIYKAEKAALNTIFY